MTRTKWDLGPTKPDLFSSHFTVPDGPAPWGLQHAYLCEEEPTNIEIVSGFNLDRIELKQLKTGSWVAENIQICSNLDKYLF